MLQRVQNTADSARGGAGHSDRKLGLINTPPELDLAQAAKLLKIQQHLK